ncbi:hypothetical protein QA601_05205 [Chitinispirillales bacterium ANBcel5]|uniref:hypothetical protein n=1 Tax=Cellulosispirillum alkaliphilum TaxID=3039283 RepID=UPI002A50CC99|nr:hypothetical protein [Chitinispirillales bacterium ANBcel5]
MKKRACITVALVTLVVSSYGYSGSWFGSGRNPTPVFRNYLMLGADWVDVDDLNSVLEEFELGEFSPYSFSATFGWDAIRNRILMGGEIGGLFWRQSETQGSRTNFFSSRVLLNNGIALVQTGNFVLYPLVGVGLGLSSLTIAPDETTFEDALNTPDETLKLRRFSFIINLGAGVTFSTTSPGRAGVRLIGIRAGYMFDPARGSDWNRGTTTVVDGPDPRLRGPYVRLLFGSGIPMARRR